jgi:hypothetical protein
MYENIKPEESKAIKFNCHDLTPFERVMMGGSVEVVIDGNKIFLNGGELKKLKKDKEALRAILTPISLTEGKRTLEEVRQVRTHGETFSGFLIAFEEEQQSKYMDEEIRLTFRLGELDENGQLKTFGIYFSQNGQKIDMPEKAPEKIVIDDGFKDLIRHTGNADGAMQYEINTGEEE